MHPKKASPTDDQVAEALRWITEVFANAGAPYQAVGGLAARTYGATRPLIDLDFYVPAEDLPRLVEHVADSCVWGPEHFRDENWDLTFAKLRKHGVQIELAEAEGARFYNPKAASWQDQGIMFDRSDRREFLGVEIEVMPRDRLIEYKRALDRPVDRLDLSEIED